MHPDGLPLPPLATEPPARRLADRFPARRRASISLTPLIDVVFILLVFFMLASSFLDWRAIDLRAPGRAASMTALEGALFVEVRKDGLRLGGLRVDLAALQDAARRRATDGKARAVVRADDGVTLQQTVAVLDALAAAGVADIAMVGR
jgi:biopolymer transport protein ExbD